MISVNFIVPKEKLILVYSEDTLANALAMIEKGNFLSLPVMEGEKLLGVISKEKILKTLLERDHDNILVKDLTRKDIPSLTLFDDVEEAARILAETNIPFIVVNDENGNMLGIITHKTIFKHYTHLYGNNKGHKIVVTTYDIKGRLAQLTDVISKSGGNIISLVIDDPHVPTKVVRIILRIEGEQIDRIKEAIENAGFSIR